MSEKTEEATPKKKDQARKDGNIAKSAELTGAAVTVACFATLLISSSWLVEHHAALLLRSIHIATQPHLTLQHVHALSLHALHTFALTTAPILAVAFASAAFFSYMQVGALFTLKPLSPDLKRIDPIQGAKNLFTKDKFVNLIKNLLKIVLMSVIGYLSLKDEAALLLHTPSMHLLQATPILTSAAVSLSLKSLAAMLTFGIFDVFWQRYQHGEKLKMSKDEVQREYKESEGDPMLKGQRKQLHQELINSPVVRNAVRDADALIVNPTHVAVALRYNSDEMHAPTVLFAAKGELAGHMRSLAKRYNIPIVRNVTLARSLAELHANQEIPEELYEPVAALLNFVYSLRQSQE